MEVTCVLPQENLVASVLALIPGFLLAMSITWYFSLKLRVFLDVLAALDLALETAEEDAISIDCRAGWGSC